MPTQWKWQRHSARPVDRFKFNLIWRKNYPFCYELPALMKHDQGSQHLVRPATTLTTTLPDGRSTIPTLSWCGGEVRFVPSLVWWPVFLYGRQVAVGCRLTLIFLVSNSTGCRCYERWAVIFALNIQDSQISSSRNYRLHLLCEIGFLISYLKTRSMYDRVMIMIFLCISDLLITPLRAINLKEYHSV